MSGIDGHTKLDRRATLIRRFQRTMKRHERRAKRMGATKTAQVLRVFRMLVPGGYGTPAHLYIAATKLRRDGARTRAWLYDRAADAVARLRSDLEAVK